MIFGGLVETSGVLCLDAIFNFQDIRLKFVV